jgi:hypothetical protein
MHALSYERNFFAICLTVVGVVGVSTNASGQSMGDAAAPLCEAGPAVSDAGFDTQSWTGPTGVGADPGAVILDDGTVPPYCAGDVFQVLGVQNPNVPGFAFTSVKAPYATPAGCPTFDSQDGHATARACLCKNCYALMDQCDALPGCLAIHKCELDAGCTDPNTCYFSGACSAQIDLWGTGSIATALTNSLGTCGKAHGCPAQ